MKNKTLSIIKSIGITAAFVVLLVGVFTNSSGTNREIQMVFADSELILGCTDSSATNYNSEATQDDESCIYPDNDADDDGILDDIDNCLNTPNADQGDVDDNGVGDACDEIPNDDFIDVCPNIEEAQTEVPEGFHLDDGQCVEDSNETQPAQCDIVSDVTNIVEGGSNAVETFNHPITWVDEATLGSGAVWIWETFYVQTPALDETKVFVKTFFLNSSVDSASINIAADNGFILEINGTVITNQFGIGDNFTAIKTYSVSNLVVGENTIRITVKNFAQKMSTATSNPAGLLYKLHINNSSCSDETESSEVFPICSDGIDNDNDGLTDLNDSGCTDANDANETDPVPVLAICGDDIDNDQDGLVDVGDPGCSSPSDNDETDTPPASSGSDSGGGGGSSGGIFSALTETKRGKVLGASTSCGIYVEKFLRKGYLNDPEQVKKLQVFLGDYLKISLNADGNFGKQTEDAVKQFQTMFSDEILGPWKIDKTTGIVFRTTARKINNLMCPELNLPVPVNLLGWSKDPETRKH